MIYFFERKSWMIIHEFMIEAMGGKPYLSMSWFSLNNGVSVVV